MKRKIVFALIVTCVMLILSSCGETFESFTYENEEPIPRATYDFTDADQMKLDGEKEACYGQKVYRLYNRNNTSSKVYMDCYIYFGKEGLHCFVDVKDNVLSYNSKRAVYYNSSVELFFNDWKKTYIDKSTCQYRIAAGGKSTQLCGVKGKSTYVTSYFDGQFAVRLDGELNSNNANGFSVETFIPWYELGYRPDAAGNYDVDGIMFYPAYNKVNDPQGRENYTSRIRTSRTYCFQATPYSWVPVKRTDNDSGENVSFENDFFGAVGGAESYYGFTDSGDGKVALRSGSSTSYAFVKDLSSNDCYFETTVENVAGDSSKSPKTGLAVFYMGNRVLLYIKTSDAKRVGIAQRDAANSEWNWTVEKGGTYINDTSKEPSEANYLKKVKLAVYRKGDLICFFVNDVLYFVSDGTDPDEDPVCKTADGVTLSPKFGKIYLHDTITEDGQEAEETIMGIWSASATATYSAYSACTGAAADAKFAQLLNL